MQLNPPRPSRSEQTESRVQLVILLLVGLMAGAASFTHVHDWTMANSPQGTGEWFGWANAVISELTPTASALEVRRRKRTGQSTVYPMLVLIAAAVLSIAAQIAVAKPHPTGWLVAAIPALAFSPSPSWCSHVPPPPNRRHPKRPSHPDLTRNPRLNLR